MWRVFVEVINGCAFPFIEIFNFVEIHSTYCLYVQNDLEFLNPIVVGALVPLHFGWGQKCPTPLTHEIYMELT